MVFPNPIIPGNLRSKLAPPASGAVRVDRTALVNHVCDAPGAKLVVVRAPAGFGKTTLLEQCRMRMAASDLTTAWLTLDASDNDISRFLTCLFAAVAGMTGDDDFLQRIGRWTTCQTSADIALKMLQSLSQISRPYALFMDEFEVMHEPGALAITRQIIDQLPPWGRLVIGSRTSPDLGLGRLRGSGLLRELLVRDLRFSLEETRQLFAGRLHISLDGEDLALLHRRTEGWPAALWLALLALERHDSRRLFIECFSGTDDSLAGYLTEAVLDRQAEPIRRFLLYTSILRQLTVPLCQTLVPEEDCGAMLEHIADTEIPLTSLGGVERCYRYHSLFAGFLKSRLEREAPEEVPRLHRAASAWYEGQGRPVPAIDHAIEAGDHVGAVELLRKHAQSLLAEGRVRLLAHWFRHLPAGLLQQHPLLQAIEIWAVCYAQGAEEASVLLDESGLESNDAPELRNYVMPLRPLLLAMLDRVEEAHAAARQRIAEMPTAPTFADAVMVFTAAAMEANMGEHSAARALLETGRRLQAGAVTAFAVLHAETIEGQIDLHEGRLRQARSRFRMALDVSQQVGRHDSMGNAWAGVLYAITLYELDDLAEARRLLQVYGPLIRDLGLADQVILGHVPLARLSVHRGDVDQGFQILGELEYYGRQRNLSRVVAAAKLERSRILLMQGHTAAAREALDLAEDEVLWKRVGKLRLAAHELDDMTIARLRWNVIAGNATLALPALEQAITQASAGLRHHRALKLELLRAMALSRCGTPERALTAMDNLLKKACAEGFFRLIVDEGTEAGLLVSRCVALSATRSGPQARSAFAEYLQRLLTAFNLSVPPLDDAPVSLLPLTHKEVKVLKLLANGHSDAVMAQRLVLSTSTVRSHLRNIYSKLDVHSRMQAVVCAQRAGVI